MKKLFYQVLCFLGFHLNPMQVSYSLSMRGGKECRHCHKELS